MNQTEKAQSALLPAIIAVSSSAIFIRWAAAVPLAAAFWRSAMAGLLFLPLFLIPRFRRELHSLSRKRIGVIAAATVIIALHQICFITSLSYTSIAASTFLTSTQPIFTAFFGSLILKERVGIKSWGMIAGALVGMALITMDRPIEGAFFGNMLAVLAAILAALYSLAARKLRQTTPLVPFMMIVHISGSLFLGLLLFVFDIPFAGYEMKTWLGLFLLAFLPTAIGHSLLTFSVGFLPAFIVSSSLLGEPVGATILGALFLGEVPGIQTIIGAAIIILFILGIVRTGHIRVIPEPLRD
ncbi:DMT family transporter [bacterium]|nr:DMT family transporter [bacterium]MBU1636539.1 DMT family transporter [bacterium]MBU1920071.1 DMT family transporter [bacterium]